MKQANVDKVRTEIDVALHVRAWIETEIANNAYSRLKVALHVRAWIETINIAKLSERAKSPSM